MNIILASASPRRAELLDQLGLAYQIQSVDVDESLQLGEVASDYVRRLAIEKASAIRLPEAEHVVVIGADTSVELNGAILGKPQSREQAIMMLTALSANTHRVYTGVCVISSLGLDALVSITEVEFRDISRDEMDAYWRSGEPHDKAGAYAIQGRAAIFVKQIQGSYSGVVGLPLFETANLLGKHHVEIMTEMRK